MFAEKFQTKNLKKYRHLVACLIDISIGYFTPASALRAIEAYKNNEPFYCEWFIDIAYKQKKYNPAVVPSNETEHYLQINRNIIKDSLRYRKASSHKQCLAIVDRNIAGNLSIGASWF